LELLAESFQGIPIFDIYIWYIYNIYMTDQVVFKIDSKLKKEAMQKSKKDGVALSYILKSAVRDYVSGDLKLSLVKQNDDVDIYGSMEDFRQTAASDVLNSLGPISKDEYDYYQNLPALK
jgi:hypothetical protein